MHLPKEEFMFRRSGLNEIHRCRYALFSIVCLFTTISLFAADSVAVENAKTGTTAWQITSTNVSIDSAQPSTLVDCSSQACYSQGPIEGYASATSVNQGQSISLYVKSDESYTVRIYRIGWYDGNGGKDYTPTDLVSARSANSQSSGRYCTSSSGYALYGLVECNWSDPYVLSVPSDWVSGVYLAKLTTQTSGKSKYIIFVVRDDARPSPYLAQLSVTTYQAYNIWGGTSLYDNYSSTASASATDCTSTCDSNGVKASFLRPYQGGYGTGQFLEVDIQMIRFLEREGYDVTYATDVDTHANPTLLFSHKAFLSVGHDEYWTWEMRSSVERARERGVSLGFFGANSVFWRIRLEPSTIGTPKANQTVVAFRGTTTTRWNGWADPSNYNVTTHWRADKPGDPEPKPEQALMGVQFKEYMSGVKPCMSGDITIANTANWPPWLHAGTGLDDNDELLGLLGHETDVIAEDTVNGVDYGNFIPPGTIMLADSEFPDPDYISGGAANPIPAHMAYYKDASGAHVFATGSIFWNWGLDDYHMYQFVAPHCSGSWTFPPESSGAQQMMRNFLAEVVKPVSTSYNTRPVQWSDSTLTGVTVTNTVGNNLQKSAITNAWDAGAVSSQQLDSGDGYIEVTATETNLARGFGFTHEHLSNTYSDIQFGMQLKADGKLGYLEGTSYGDIVVSSVAVTYATGDRLRVAVVGSQVQYSKNGIVIRTISPTITYPLMVNGQFFNTQATLEDVVVSSGFSNIVQWAGPTLSGVTVSNNAGNNLQKSATTYVWDSGTVSSQRLDSGSGYVEVTATETNLARGFGFSHVHGSNTYSDIEFGMQLKADGKLGYLEGTSYGDILVSSVAVTYSTGDRLRVAVVGSQVQYSKNGTVIRTISPTITYPLMANAQFFSPQATLKNAVVSPSFANLVKWMGSSLTGVSVGNVAGNNVSKSATTNAWDAGAVSIQQIESGNGYVELMVTETNKARGFGLSHVHGQNTYVDIQFGFQLGADGNLYRFESGSYPALNQSYATGDRLRVAIVGSDIKYYKNGTLLHTLSAPTLSYPYMANAQFFNTQATLQNIVISSP
jgi:hypothetical protein